MKVSRYKVDRALMGEIPPSQLNLEEAKLFEKTRAQYHSYSQRYSQLRTPPSSPKILKLLGFRSYLGLFIASASLLTTSVLLHDWIKRENPEVAIPAEVNPIPEELGEKLGFDVYSDLNTRIEIWAWRRDGDEVRSFQLQDSTASAQVGDQLQVALDNSDRTVYVGVYIFEEGELKPLFPRTLDRLEKVKTKPRWEMTYRYLVTRPLPSSQIVVIASNQNQAVSDWIHHLDQKNEKRSNSWGLKRDTIWIEIHRQSLGGMKKIDTNNQN